MAEKEQYLGILDINGKILIAEGESLEKVKDQFGSILERMQYSYPNKQWQEYLRFFKVEEIKDVYSNQ